MIILEPSQVFLRSGKASEGNRWAANRINGPAAVNSWGRNESLPMLEGRKPAKELAMSSTNGTECRSLIVLGTDLFLQPSTLSFRALKASLPLSLAAPLYNAFTELETARQAFYFFLSFFLSFFRPPPPPPPTHTHTDLIFLLLYGKDAF